MAFATPEKIGLYDAETDTISPMNRPKLTLKPLFLEKKNESAPLQWEKRTISAAENSSSKVTTRKIEVPTFWSATATKILSSKYLKFTKGPRAINENSLTQIVERIVSPIAHATVTNHIFTAQDAKTFAKELSHLLIHQVAAFNSPVWFNLGIFEKYKLKSDHLNFRAVWKGTKISCIPVDSLQFPQTSACFILSCQDDLSEIFNLLKTEALIFKYGSGVGANYSNLRARDEHLSGGGSSSGLMSFLEVFDRAAGTIKSGGTVRRAAKMVCIDADHPEIESFIDWKVKEEKKIRALSEAGFSIGMDGEASKSVSGQNSNNSICLSDQFMQTVRRGKQWNLCERKTKRVSRKVYAKAIFERIAQAAWHCADPGVLFIDTINSWNPCADIGKIQASNPCAEFLFLNDTACNLSSLNLLKFLSPSGEFQTENYLLACRLMTIAQESLIDLSSYPTEKVAMNSASLRPIGLGYTNLGALLMTLGLPYDSEKARTTAAAITCLTLASAMHTSAELARVRKPYKFFHKCKSSTYEVFHRHLQAAEKLANSTGLPLAEQAYRELANAIKTVHKYGIRNAQLTAIAPTGTISLLMDCQTTGIEPEYSLLKEKTLVGGEMMKFTNNAIEPALASLGYNSNARSKIISHIMNTGTIEGCSHLNEEHLAVFDCAIPNQPGGRFISADGHLKMLAACQPFVSGGISKTINLPHHATPKEIETIYFKAWQLGLKSVAVYRDQSKSVQPLNLRAEGKCSSCGGKMVAAGNCYTCTECGDSTSCQS